MIKSMPYEETFMDWRANFIKTGRNFRQRIATSIGAAGIIAVGLAGTEAYGADASLVKLRTQATTPIETVSGDRSTLVSLDLFEILGNVFRYIQVSNISDEEEIAIGRRINRMLLDQQYQLYNDSRVQSYVDRIGQRLVEMSDSRDIPFKFQVVVSDQINAFAVPGGYVYVTTGLLRAADNEAQLASVLAHEISHINERHSIEAIRQATLAQGIAETANIETSTLAQLGYQLAVNLPRSRDFEYEADEGGLAILREAGYPTMAFVNFLQKLQSASGQPEFLRTHPTSENRIEELRNQIAQSDYNSQLGMQEATYENIIYPLN